MLNVWLYSFRKRALFSFSEVGCVENAWARERSAVRLRSVTRSPRITVGAGVSVLTVASLKDIGMKPGGTGTIFSSPALSEESGSNSMSVPVGVEVASWVVDALLD